VQSMKEPFNDVSAFIERLVIRAGVGATRPGWNHSHPAPETIAALKASESWSPLSPITDL
ncbi:MAG: hypothetical protein OXI24_10320, partial [Candidatus Poribacteria bacterium]|nr:hypothetical protein [Candidatus Poribacteria bacterium]